MPTAHFSLINRIKVYTDALATDNPKEIVINEQKEIAKDFTDYHDFGCVTVAAGTAFVVPMPATPASFLYVLTDTQISLRFNGEGTDNSLVVPSVQGTQDGLFVKRGTFNSLIINNATANKAQVVVFIGV